MATERKPEGKMDQEAVMDVYRKIGTPGKEHNLLSRMAGRWKTVTRSWNEPGKPPEESAGICEQKMILGGRFLQHVLAVVGEARDLDVHRTRAAAAGRALAYIKGPEADQSNHPPLLHRSLDRRDRCVERASRGRLGNIRGLGDIVDNLGLVHLASKNWDHGNDGALRRKPRLNFGCSVYRVENALADPLAWVRTL